MMTNKISDTWHVVRRHVMSKKAQLMQILNFQNNLTTKEVYTIILQIIYVSAIASVSYLTILLLFRSTLRMIPTNQYHERFNLYFLSKPQRIVYFENGLVAVYVLIMVLVSYRRYRRMIKSIQFGKIQEYLKYMAQGHYDIKIPIELVYEYKNLAMNVNTLASSMSQALSQRIESEKTKNELMNNIGHDIRTPLTAVIGYLSLLKNSPDLPKDEIQSYINISYEKSKRLELLVNDLFEYTSSQQSTATMSYQSLNIASFIEQAVSDFYLEAEEKGIDIEIIVSPSTLVGELDPDKMARVFTNLVSNALKYGTGASRIMITAHQQSHADFKYTVPLSQQRDIEKLKNVTSWLLFEVKNNGELLPVEELTRIFRRSYRSDSSRNSKQHGSGLGLAIVKNLVKLHCGQVYAKIDHNDMVFCIQIPQFEEHHAA